MARFVYSLTSQVKAHAKDRKGDQHSTISHGTKYLREAHKQSCVDTAVTCVQRDITDIPRGIEEKDAAALSGITKKPGGKRTITSSASSGVVFHAAQPPGGGNACPDVFSTPHPSKLPPPSPSVLRAARSQYGASGDADGEQLKATWSNLVYEFKKLTEAFKLAKVARTIRVFEAAKAPGDALEAKLAVDRRSAEAA